MASKIFITGGSGYIGSQVIAQALAKGYTVRALSRSPSSDGKLTSLGATPVRGDLTTFDVLTKEAAQADIVINLADSFAGQYGKITLEQRFAINNAAIEALAEGLKGSGKPLVLTGGTLFTAADPEGKETDEDSPPWGDVPFGEGFPMDRQQHLRDEGIRVCTVRLAPLVYGRGGSGVQLFMGTFAQAGQAFYVDDGAEYTTTVHVDDAARLYLLVAEKGKTGEAYNAASETNVTHKQLAEAIAQALSIPLKSQSFETTVATMGKFFASFLKLGNRASHAKAKRELGWEPKVKMGILDDIEKGSYVEVANSLKNQ